MNVRSRANRLGQRSSVGVAQPRATAGRAAIDAEKERRAGHTAALGFQFVEDRRGSGPKRVRSFGRREPLFIRPSRRLLGRHRQMHKDGGDRDRFSLRYCKAPK